MSDQEGSEITVTHDALIDQITARMAEEYARASDASESGAKIKEFLEETNLNSQAFSWLKSIVKKLPKKDGQAKAMDIIRSMRIGLDMIENHVQGQGTQEMDLGEPQSEEPQAEASTPQPEAVGSTPQPEAVGSTPGWDEGEPVAAE